jgi:murein L,D-transpeptidase YafK
MRHYLDERIPLSGDGDGISFIRRAGKILLTLVLAGLCAKPLFAQSFLAEQKKFERVRGALDEKESLVVKTITESGLKVDDLHILLVAYKAEHVLEIHARKKTGTVYKKLKTYDICNLSGQLGPKRKMGDLQVPEGFYHIDRFNPKSNYHLSLGINYPNASDRIKSTASNPGGDIFIHGSCVTVGCLPMTTDKIKEIYLYATYARNNGQTRIPVYIFPFKMHPENMKKYTARYRDQPELLAFWHNLKTGHDQFGKEKKALSFSVDEKSGDYRF